MADKQSKKPVPIYQLKITLRDINPPILRILQVKGNCNLGKLHHYIQGVTEWTDTHLHEYKIKTSGYLDIEQMDESMDETDVFDEQKYRLNKLLSEGDSFVYIYDFGDYWEHDILVEKIIPPKDGVYYPICVSS